MKITISADIHVGVQGKLDECSDQHVVVVDIAQPLQDQTVGEIAEEADYHAGRQRAQEVAAQGLRAPANDVESDVHADHEEMAVRHVEDFQDPEDPGQPRRDEEDGHAGSNTVVGRKQPFE